MGPRIEVVSTLLFATLVSFNLIVCNVDASRVARFFNKEPTYNNPNERETSGYMDPKEYYPTGTENSYNGYEPGEGRRSGYGNGVGEGGGYREGVNGYGRAAEFTTENEGGAFGNGGGYGSGEWHGSNGGGGYGQGAEYVSGYGNGYNEFGNGNGNGNGYGSGSGAGYGNGNGNGNGNGEYIPNNAYRQENP